MLVSTLMYLQHLVKVSGITEKNTESFDDIANLLRIGESMRVVRHVIIHGSTLQFCFLGFRSVGETQLNERSSRSHTIFTLTIESKLKEEKDTETDGVVKVATLVSWVRVCAGVFLIEYATARDLPAKK